MCSIVQYMYILYSIPGYARDLVWARLLSVGKLTEFV